MTQPIKTLSVLFARLWARYGASAPQLQGGVQRAARDYALMRYLRGYERGRQDAREGVRRPW